MWLCDRNLQDDNNFTLGIDKSEKITYNAHKFRKLYYPGIPQAIKNAESFLAAFPNCSIIWELTYLNCLTFLNSMFNQGEPIFVDPAFTVIGTGRDHLPFT